MNKEQSPYLLIGLAVLVILGFLGLKMRDKNALKKPDAPQMEAPMASSPTPTPEPTPEAEPTPEQPENPPPTPPLPTPVTSQHQFPVTPPASFPKEMMAALKMQQNTAKAAFANEGAARTQIKNLEKCLTSTTPLGMPAEQLNMIPESARNQLMVETQSKCIAFARKLAEKYPSLQSEYQAGIASKASPAALEASKFAPAPDGN